MEQLDSILDKTKLHPLLPISFLDLSGYNFRLNAVIVSNRAVVQLFAARVIGIYHVSTVYPTTVQLLCMSSCRPITLALVDRVFKDLVCLLLT